MKYNGWCDGSYKDGQAIIGFVIRNEHNTLIDFGYKEIPNCEDSKEAEIFSMFELLKRCKTLRIKTLTIHNDCKTLIEAIKLKKTKNPRLFMHIQRFTSYMKLYFDKNGISLVWIPRILNREAHLICSEKTLPNTEKILSDKELTRILLEHDYQTDYIVLEAARQHYNDHCPRSYKKCKSNQELDLKIIRSVELGETINEVGSRKFIKYWNLVFEIENKTIHSIDYCSNGSVVILDAQKDKWYEEFALRVFKEQANVY